MRQGASSCHVAAPREKSDAMSFSICPTATVAAPVNSVWELLSDPTLYDIWWDARTERIEPEGKATPGQILYANTSAFGRTWALTLTVQAVNPDKHRVQIDAALPLGTINHATITATAIDATTSFVQFG